MNVKALFIHVHFGLLRACEMSRLSRAVIEVVTLIHRSSNRWCSGDLSAEHMVPLPPIDHSPNWYGYVGSNKSTVPATGLWGRCLLPMTTGVREVAKAFLIQTRGEYFTAYWHFDLFWRTWEVQWRHFCWEVFCRLLQKWNLVAVYQEISKSINIYIRKQVCT